MRSTLNNTAPRKYQFLSSRPKAKLTEFGILNVNQERQRRIETDNTILVGKMLSTQSSVKPMQIVHFKESLNNAFSKKKEREIDINNQVSQMIS